MYQTLARSAAVLLAMTASSTAFAGHNLLGGQVIDRNGHPVERAVVSLTPGNVQIVTDSQGNFAIDYLRDTDGKRIHLFKKTNYTLDVYKPGYHPYTIAVYYKRGAVAMEAITLAEDAIRIEELPANLDPGAHEDPTHTAGATYEGQ